jgi:hypothetical protein
MRQINIRGFKSVSTIDIDSLTRTALCSYRYTVRGRLKPSSSWIESEFVSAKLAKQAVQAMKNARFCDIETERHPLMACKKCMRKHIGECKGDGIFSEPETIRQIVQEMDQSKQRI